MVYTIRKYNYRLPYGHNSRNFRGKSEDMKRTKLNEIGGSAISAPRIRLAYSVLSTSFINVVKLIGVGV